MKKLRTTLGNLSRKFALLGIMGMVGLAIIVPTTAMASAPQKCDKNDVKCVIAFGDKEIANRQAALTTLNNKVTQQESAGHLTSDQANVLLADVSTNQSGLAALKSKLDGDTDAATARQDVESIYTDFRIYAVVLPRNYSRIHVDEEANLQSKLKNLEPQLENAIEKAPASQQGQLRDLFNDYKAHVASAETEIDAAIADFPALTPTNYDTNRSAYDASFKNLVSNEKAAHEDLHQVAKDLHQIAQLLKSDKSANATATPTK